MRNSVRVAISLFAIMLFVSAAAAQKDRNKIEIVVPAGYAEPAIEHSNELQTVLNAAIGEVLNSYPARSFKAQDITATLIDLRDPKDLKWANFSGDRQLYPASVVKIFFMAALERQLED